MKNRKFSGRILALMLCAALLLALAGCGGDESEKNSGDDTGAIANTSVDISGDGSLTSEEESSEEVSVEDYVPLNYETVKGMWLSQFDMSSVYKDGGISQKRETTYRKMIDNICKALSENGFNTAILQVRPYADSFYPSEVYCPSRYVTGSYETDFEYDPFAIFIEIAHSYELSVHAWLNPMRCMEESFIGQVSTDYLLGQWYQDEALREKYLYYNPDATGNSYYYLNPAYEEVRNMIIDGVEEICTKYKVDAIHIDDYFYPTTSVEFDRAVYMEKRAGRSLREFRTATVNDMVSGIFDAIKAIKPGILFGISPAGNIENNTVTLYADVITWCSTPGYCDYIVPQVYWGFEHSSRDSRFDVCCTDWQNLVTTDAVSLYIGLAIYRANAPTNEGDSAEWYNNKDVIKRELEYMQNMEKCEGFVMFSFLDLFQTNGRYTGGLRLERENFLPVLKEFGNK